MPNYPTKYLFIAQTQGIAQAAAQLNALHAAMNKINTVQGSVAGIGGTGGASSFGPGKNAAKDWDGLSGYIEKFGHRMRSALAYSLAFGAVGATFAAVGATVRAWTDAQIQLNTVIADTAILLGRSAEAGQQFANTQRSLAFATGQSLAEVAPSSMMAERVGQPELAKSAAEWSMVVGPQLNAVETIDDLRALSIQFGLSMDQINNGLLATMQNSGISADQLFDLSASFGVFAGQLGLGETEKDLREIAGLFAALSNITGQTTPTLQNFVRRMADEFYAPDAALRQQLEASGIQTVTKGAVTTDMFGNKSFEEIRRPFTEIFAEIAQKGPAAIKQFSTAIDNSLGQPTQSQFILIAENWSKVSQSIGSVVASTADFSDAVLIASEKTSVAFDRMKIGFVNFLGVLGDGGMLAASFNNIGSALQNVYDRTKDPDKGFRDAESYRRDNVAFGIDSNVVPQVVRWHTEKALEEAYGDTGLGPAFHRRSKEIVDVMNIPESLSEEQAIRYSVNAIEQFARSNYVIPAGTPGYEGAIAGAQSYKRFELNDEIDMISALRSAIPGITDEDILTRFDGILSEMERRVLSPRTSPPVAGWIAGIDDPISTLPPWGAGGARSLRVRNQMIPQAMTQQFGSPFDMKQISLPEGMTPEDFDKAYDEVSATLTERFGPAISEAAVEAIAFSDETSGLIVAVGAYSAEIAQATIKNAQATGENNAASGVLTGSFYNLAGAADAVAGGLSAILSRARVTLPEGMTADQWEAEYNKTEGLLGSIFGPGANLSDQAPKPYIFMDPSTGMPLADGGDLNPDVVAITNERLSVEQAARDKAAAEQKGYYNKALSAQEAYQNKMLGSWNSMIGDLLKPSAVTGTDLFYNSQTGAYNDNWDEPVRRMKADINNAIAGKPLEYGYGGLAPYMNMGAINAAMGMDQASKEGILRSEEAGVSERFYNMELPWEAYSGNTDSIIANAQSWIAGKQQKNANMANVQQLLIDAGLGPDAEAFVKAMEEPPILRSLFGGKSADEINTTVTEAVTPDMGKALTEQVANTPWSLTISGAIQKDVTNNYEVIVSAGMAIGKGLAEGSASMFAAAIIPLVLAAIVGRE